MKDVLITTLRDKMSSRAAYRDATDKLASLLALEAADWLPQKSVRVETPVGETEGVQLSGKIILVPILRSGLALLYPFLRYFPEASVGFVGMRRDEKTFEAHNYYKNIPQIGREDHVVILEPMIATGGSGMATLDILQEMGASPEKILYVSVIAAPEGLMLIRSKYPAVKMIVAQTDKTLNAAKFIVPGLGDFGDRYFGT